MTKQEHINYWVTTSEKDFQRAELLFREKDYLFALFCLHLSLEKMLKAIWVKTHTENAPPRIHNLTRLKEYSNLKLKLEEEIFLGDMNRFQLEGRYPEYLDVTRKEVNANFTSEMISFSKPLILCFKEMLQ